MGGSKKNRRKNPADDSGVDLLSLAFNLPTRRDFEPADRVADQNHVHKQSIRVQYDAGEDESSETESSTGSRAESKRSDVQDADETPKARKSSKPRQQQQQQQQQKQVKEKKNNRRAPSPKDDQKTPDRAKVPLLARRLSKRDTSKPPKSRGRSSSSPASTRASSPAFSIPSSATFPRATSRHSQKAANLTASDASARPLQLHIGGGAQPQQFYQPMFAFPTASVYPQTQYYSTVGNDSTFGCNQFVPFPMSPLPSTNTTTSPQPRNLISQQVQHIQSELDEVVMKLSQNPEDATLKGNLSALQTELNTRLNSLLGTERQKEPKASDASKPHDLTMMSSMSQLTTIQQERSPKRKIRHHLCTGCGKVRSSDYHNKRPVIPGHRPSKNYCEDCFEENVEKGILEHHFCYGCGTVRSKDFHQNHPISKEDKPFPNYCSICVEEIRSAETVADFSVVDFAPETRSSENYSYSDTARGQFQNYKQVDPFKSREGLITQDNQSNILLNSAPGNNGDKIDSYGRKKMSHTLKISTGGPQLSSSNSSPDSPYYPVRHTGASQRRAQRSPLASPGSQYCSSPDTPATPRYQSPYVEDVVSPIQEAKKPDGDHQFHSTAPSGRDSQSGRFHRSAEDHSSDISQEVSDDSTEGHASTDDSAQSTGSKSVKFRSKVDIRLSDSRTSSNASSHAKILEEDIKPDDDTIPSRVGIYGTSPVKSQNGYYPRALGSHKVPSSAAVEDGYVETIPERSYRGAFSKDSPASSWQPPTSNAGGDYWYSRPSTYHSTTTPSSTTEGFKGFRPGGHSTFNYGSKSGNGNENGAPPLRTTGDTFNPTDADTTKERESQKTPLSPTSGSQSQGPPESSGSSWRYYTSPFGGDQKAESTFKKTSPWSNFSSRSDPECHTMQDDSSLSQSAFSDYSQPSSNPYYEPRKRTFPDINDYCFFGTRTHRTPGKWAKDYQSATKLPKPTPYWIPEPIIEEPDSPESSPGKKSNMLEFDDIDISPASVSNLATNSSPDSAEGKVDLTGPEIKLDDESDKENAPSKNSDDEPSSE
ncbi:hypothetical protein H0G86_005976 [Trichoderma simmonsii]|uniref:Uncharacterized protein n=1 Tax=Trichoderma simmonsii TaxID=1491479 RepID=A0A8G0LCM5_9HYPO|nr:hypothetical protein H0G86_005976 [Trichoderma simmonsii]